MKRHDPSHMIETLDCDECDDDDDEDYDDEEEANQHQYDEDDDEDLVNEDILEINRKLDCAEDELEKTNIWTSSVNGNPSLPNHNLARKR